MRKLRTDIARQDGFALAYMAVILLGLLLFTGLAVDSGRAYVVKSQLTKAVDGAALGAARNLNSGNPRSEAANIFKANFPAGFMGTSSVTDPVTDGSFYSLVTDNATGVNTITITAHADMPTSFMQLGNLNQVTVSSDGQATRRMVDLSLVLDVSSSIAGQWSAVHDASVAFINAFDGAHDRLSLSTFSNGATVLNQMPNSRGFAKVAMMANVPTVLPGGSTNMVEGLYRAWDELRTVPSGQQSSLRIIVLFTDGASNGVPGNYDAALGRATTLRTWDFPKFLPDPAAQTWDSPHIDGLYDSSTGVTGPAMTLTTPWNSTATIGGAVPMFLPLNSWHTNHRSGGMPTQFPLQTGSLNVNGVPQNIARGLRTVNPATGRFPAQVYNINNAARNLVEIISNEARNDAGGDYPIRVYTIGMGELVTYLLGTRAEPSSEVLMRMANDRLSQDFNPAQLEGKYYYAQTAGDVSAAFQGIQNQILRLTK